MEPVVDDAGDELPASEPVGRRLPGPAAREPRPATQAVRDPGLRRELVVDASGAGDHVEIDDAVAVAEDGDVVFVRPGTYRRPVVVDRAVELQGDGPLEAIVLEPVGAEALSLCASGASARNLTIRPALVGNDGVAHSAIWVRDVVVTIEDCDLSSHLGATVWVGGRSSLATIRRCRIHDGAQNGVAAWEEGSAIVEDCELTGNRWPALMAHGRHARAVGRRCRIVGNYDYGAAANDGATLELEGSLIARNGQGGVIVADATPLSRIVDNDIVENARTGIEVEDCAAVRVEGNRLRRNEVGIVIANGATPDVLANVIEDTTGASIVAIGGRTDPNVADNEIRAPRSAAILVQGGASGRFARNRITAGRQPGAWIQEHGSYPTFIENVITGSAMIGIAVTEHAGGLFERNDLRGNRGAWDVEHAGPITLRDNLEDPGGGPDSAPGPAGVIH